MNLALGTAQFGMHYGISNTAGKPNAYQAAKLVHLALELGIDTIDTASAYGDSEEILGLIGVTPFKVITKVPPLKNISIDGKNWVINNALSSLNKLKIPKLHALLLHSPRDLFGVQGKGILAGLLELKARGLVTKVGYSIYSPDEIERLINILSPDIIQAPLNVFDQRLVTSGWLKKLIDKNIEVHIRSVFLQGLLLQNDQDRHKYFLKWNSNFEAFKVRRNYRNSSSIQFCIDFIKKYADISQIIIGFNNERELHEITNALHKASPLECMNLACNDLELINPSLWKIDDA